MNCIKFFILWLFTIITILYGSVAYAGDSGRPKLEISANCLYEFQFDSISEMSAIKCKPNTKEEVGYNKESNSFTWGPRKNRDWIDFKKIGQYQNISTYSITNNLAIIRQIIFLQNDSKNIKKVLTLGGGRPCEASFSEDLKWHDGFVDAEFDYGIYLAFEHLLPKESKDSLNNSAFQGYPYADYCMLNEKRRVDLNTFKTETISYQFADTVLSVTPEPNEDLGCVNKELAKLKAQKLTRIDLPPEKAKEMIKQIYEACKDTP